MESSQKPSDHHEPGWRAAAAVTLCGVCAFLELYCTQPLLPLLARLFHASKTATGMTVSASFLALGLASLAGAAAVAAWLPHGRRRSASMLGAPGPAFGTWESNHPIELSFPYQVQSMFRNRRLIATFAVGFNVLFSLVGVFTWITFYLAAPPFSLSTTALSSLFFVYLIGLVVTPAAGFLITRVGLRAGIGGAICCSIAGVSLTLIHSLPVVILGITMLSSGVFIAQTASQSHLRIAAPSGARVTAAGLYLTCYYLGGTAAGVLPGVFWAIGKWPACVALIVAMQILALSIAVAGWRSPAPIATALPAASAAL